MLCWGERVRFLRVSIWGSWQGLKRGVVGERDRVLGGLKVELKGWGGVEREGQYEFWNLFEVLEEVVVGFERGQFSGRVCGRRVGGAFRVDVMGVVGNLSLGFQGDG